MNTGGAKLAAADPIVRFGYKAIKNIRIHTVQHWDSDLWSGLRKKS
jgi:hypothetical protein